MQTELTPAQLRVLRCALRGLDNETIADELGISANTVKAQLHQIRDRFGITETPRSYRWLVAVAYQIGSAKRQIPDLCGSTL